MSNNNRTTYAYSVTEITLPDNRMHYTEDQLGSALVTIYSIRVNVPTLLLKLKIPIQVKGDLALTNIRAITLSFLIEHDTRLTAEEVYKLDRLSIGECTTDKFKATLPPNLI